MASPRSMSARPMASPTRRYRRSSFDGSKQLSAAQAPSRRILAVLGFLALALVAALAIIAGAHFQNMSESPTVVTPPATR